VDDESYNSGHGHAYDFYRVDVEKGALALVRPDQYVSLVIPIEKHHVLRDFFKAFAKPGTQH